MDILKKFELLSKFTYDSIRNNSPRFANLQVTTMCNCRCLMCNIWKWKQEIPPLSKIKDIIEELKKIGVENLTLWGGEPYIRDDIVDIMAFIKSKKMKCGVITNGSCFSQEKLLGTSQLVDELIFSIDSMRDHIHDNIRGEKGVLRECLKNLYQLCSLRKKTKMPKEIIIDCTIQESNIDYLEEIVDFAEKYGLNVNFDPAQNYGIGNNCNPILTDIPIKRTEKTFDNLMSKKTKTLCNSKAQLKLMKEHLMGNGIELFCVSPYTALMIDHQGNVMYCWGHDRILCNILSDNFKRQWNSGEYNEFKKKIARSQLDRCKRCGFSHVRFPDKIPYYALKGLCELRVNLWGY